jgi:hypothetical protein
MEVRVDVANVPADDAARVEGGEEGVGVYFVGRIES